MEKGKSAVVEGSNINPMEMVGSRGDHHQKDDGDVNGTVCNGETLLRLLPMALCISSLVVMLKNSETNDFGTLAYSNLGAFRYLVHANGICAGYSLLSAVVAAMPRRPITMPRAWAFFLLDQVLTYVILAAATVSTEVLYLGYKGDVATTWSAACVSFGGFCHKAVAAVVITFLALACYIVLSLISSYKLFSRFGAPVSHPSKNVENPIFQG